MKLMHIIFAASALVFAVSCNKSAQATDETGNSEKEKQETVSFSKQPRTAQGVVELTDDKILRPNKTFEKVTIIDFNATWCVPCKKLSPVFGSVASETPKADFVSVDIDKCLETAKAFNVQSVPVIIILGKDGKQKARYEGTAELLPAENFAKIVKENI